MADSTYAVKVSDEVKEKLLKLVDESGQSSKDFFADMVSQFELVNAKRQAPILSADIDELVKLTTRINNIFVNVGERVLNLQETYQIEAERQTKEKDSLIDLLQQQVEGLRHDAVQTEEQVTGLMAENEALKKDKAESQKIYITEVNQLKEVNQKNNEIISRCNEKIDTLSGLVSEYKGHAAENKNLTDTVNHLKNENDGLQRQIAALTQEQQRQVDAIKADQENLKKSFLIDRDTALLELKKEHQKELAALQTDYSRKLNDYEENLKSLLFEKTQEKPMPKPSAASRKKTSANKNTGTE